MFKIVSVTNRRLCREPLAERMEKILRAGADALILREKDLTQEEYEKLAVSALAACGEHLILHSFWQTANRLHGKRLHLPLPVLQSLSEEQRSGFSQLGASCHSLSDVQQAEALGCTYVTLGHIFATDCKKGLPPRGLAFLEKAAAAARIPVFAIGGIGSGNIRLVRDVGASGACIMQGLMACENPQRELQALRDALK